ncbi:IS4 family transposase [Candidatus Bathyarchaeota archaeon]|jgi:hypothetical protein|nr:IS4 family transposase [Candidatus Bathyarchaeota archaeon]
MRSIHTLKKHLEQACLPLSSYRLDLLCHLLCGLMRVQSVNLMKLAPTLSGSSALMSRYCRLQRFFSSGLSPSSLSAFIVRRLVPLNQPLFLSLPIDRTHWKLGLTDVNVLCLGLLYKGVSTPLESMALGKAGNSNTSERKKIFRRAWKYLKDYPCCLLADREFIGADWLRFLLGHKGLDFVIRIRRDSWMTLEDGRLRHLELFTRNLPKGKTRTYESVELYDGKRAVRLNLVCHRSAQGDLVLLATNRTDLDQVLSIYKTRWSIETVFGFFKSRGFNLEDSHLTQPQRIELLFSVLALCVMWSLLVGDDSDRDHPIRCKKHGRKAISLVRLGINQIYDLLEHFDDRWKDFRACCRLLLSCT